jgi:hypothetical protein
MSNTDNMALVGVLSTQLLYSNVLHAEVLDGDSLHFKTFIDRTSETRARP